MSAITTGRAQFRPLNSTLAQRSGGTAPTVAPARASSASASTAAEARRSKEQRGLDSFADTPPSMIPLGPAVKPPQSWEEIDEMSPKELKAFTGEEVLGMNRNQFEHFKEAVTKEGGPGLMSLDPQVRKAVLRKMLMKGLMEDFQRMAQKHEKW